MYHIPFSEHKIMHHKFVTNIFTGWYSRCKPVAGKINSHSS